MGMHKGILGQSEGGGSVGDKTLDDYIRRKQRAEAFAAVAQEKKLTFEEWMETQFKGVYGYDKTSPDDFILWGMPGRLVRVIWNAAQENK